jgi:hypothetical protein
VEEWLMDEIRLMPIVFAISPAPAFPKATKPKKEYWQPSAVMSGGMESGEILASPAKVVFENNKPLTGPVAQLEKRRKEIVMINGKKFNVILR